MENKKRKFADFLVIILVVGFLGFVALAAINYKRSSTKQARELPASEIRQYEGKDLSSIQDFHENSIKGPQYIDRNSYQLKIKGLTDGEQAYAYGDIINNHQSYKKVVTLNCVEGWRVTILWEGILVKDLIDPAKITPDANTVIFRAYDGYSTSFPLEYIMSNNILMASKINGVELPPERGFPFQLVAEDKYGYKWIKWITEIEFSSDSSFRGYWESGGYSNSGDLNQNFLSK